MTRSLIAAIAIQAVLGAALALLVFDMRAHNRVERLGGVNVWGYRGLELGRKQAGELRLAMFGGDLAFGWGVAADETMVSYARRLVSVELNQAGHPSHRVTPIVAAARGMRPGDYAAWIDRFRPLQLDVVCLLPDEPDHVLDAGHYLPDRRSAIFINTGYSPILPLVLAEKAALTRSSMLRSAARMLDALDAQRQPAEERSSEWRQALPSAIAAAKRAAAIGVVLVLPPRWRERSFTPPPDDDRFRTVRLSGDPRMDDMALRLDGYHFSAGGHSRAADAIAPAALAMVRTSGVVSR
jgi:hypothetical protein